MNPGSSKPGSVSHRALPGPGSGISPAMAHRRVAHLQGLLEMLGVPASMLSSEIAPYRPGRSGLPPNFVQVNFMPGCPHPCCPGRSRSSGPDRSAAEEFRLFRNVGD